jgi:hypothetical protein
MNDISASSVASRKTMPIHPVFTNRSEGFETLYDLVEKHNCF